MNGLFGVFVHQLYPEIVHQLREVSSTPALDARVLMAHVLGVEPLCLDVRSHMPVDSAVLAPLVLRRKAGEPVARIIGRREFWGLMLTITPDVLDPRPDTETVVSAALQHLDPDNVLRLLDLGTGSGALLLALLMEYPKATGVGTDISSAALLVAQENARRLNVSERAQFIESTWAENLKGHFDLIVSNPPYIPTVKIHHLPTEVRDYDPSPALDGGADGLAAYREIAAYVPCLLAPRGHVIVEIGQGQGKDVIDIFDGAGLSVAEGGRHKDLAGIERSLVFAHEAT